MNSTIIIFILFNLLYVCALVPKPDGRIVGGVSANIEDFPYQVSLEESKSHICGGSIIQVSFVLTAAHCVEGVALNRLQIRAGTNNLRDSKAIVRGVSASYVHEKYDPIEEDYDVAILKINGKFPFSIAILPIAIPDQNEQVPEGTKGIVSGWGYTSENGYVVSKILQQVEVEFISDKTCKNLYDRQYLITPRMFCAGYLKGGKDACQGDSGGPLLAKGKLMGIVSWGYGCARPKYPGVYTKVSSVSNWIKNITGY